MILKFWRGETVRVDVVFADIAGAPMSATGVTITAKEPDGTLVVGDVSAGPTTGAYYATFALPAAGVWAVRSACTGPTASATEDRFEVAQSYVL